MLKRIKKLYQLSKKDPEVLSRLENLTDEQLALLPDEGDGKAVFFTQGSEKDYEDLKREDEGMTAWIKRIGL